ncbi:DUF2627 domain-containing protein [Mixta tenebrionis]|uniref:DUF2627 domain-containing protein n=3 Tax=Erwiniaceae TaxID=1903409 RepID=A0A506VB32_9GAMM|nr:DUF2627 domain-containing protein [Mixta tenebrionis]
MYGIFSKEVTSKDVDVEYRFLAEPYISASFSSVSGFSSVAFGQINMLRNYKRWQRLKVR